MNDNYQRDQNAYKNIKKRLNSSIQLFWRLKRNNVVTGAHFSVGSVILPQIEIMEFKYNGEHMDSSK